ncbi:HEXXH motif domain-containing protein [Parafrankia sp. CH37]|nr:HEXXH motif domain-containing protein [Parafrankia sp. CH37]
MGVTYRPATGVDGPRGPMAGGAHAQQELSAAAFDALAAGTDDGAPSRVLWRAERSRRRLLLRALLDQTRARAGVYGPLPSLDVAWELLEAAEARAPAEARAVLEHPTVGRWVAHVLRRLRGVAYSDTPLWVDLGYLHTVAASAAVRAGLDFVLRVPLRHRLLVLPTLGSGNVPGHGIWAVVALRHEAGRLRADPGGEICLDVTVAGAGWRPLPVLRAEYGDRVLTVALDDTDPFRQIATPARPLRLETSSVRHWEKTLAAAWEILVTRFPRQAVLLSQAPLMLAPIPNRQRFRINSASDGDAVGSISLAETNHGPWLAETLLHELAHARLGALFNLTELLVRRPGPVGYAPWRDDPRPLQGMLHGVYAFLEVTAFWRTWRRALDGAARLHADFEFALARGQVDEALRQVRVHPDLTQAGHRFVTGLVLRLESWLGEPVASEAERFAGLARHVHRTRWLLRRHTAEVVRPVPLQGLTDLCRLQLLEPREFRTRAAQAIAGATRPGDALLPADWLLVAGDLAGARGGYERAARADPADDRAVAGLAACRILEARPGPTTWDDGVGDLSGLPV